MRVTYGRERSKTARRATVDISPEFGTTSAGRRSGRTPCCLHNNCRRKELCAIALRHPQMSPFPVSIERRDLIRSTHKLHRLYNITSSATSPAALADGPSTTVSANGSSRVRVSLKLVAASLGHGPTAFGRVEPLANAAAVLSATDPSRSHAAGQ